MRNLVSVLFIFLVAQIASAQIQQGYVKTKGRMVEGKHVKGHGIKGAVVQLQGRTAVGVQNDDGQFSFPIVGVNYTVQSVIKNGYQLVDADAAPKTYSYSNNPLYIVMETPEQQTQDLLESERKIRRTLQRQLQKREDELEELKETHKITLEEYQRAMQKLYADEKNNENLISMMAKEYARIDYDQMNELKQRIYDAISNGRLVEADSLMRIKGNMRSRMEKVKQKQQIENEREKEIEEETKMLNEAKGGTQKEIEEIEEDCNILRDRFMLELKIDSASYYVDLLANFDSTNVSYLARAGNFYDNICSHEKAKNYYLKALDICRHSFEEYAFEICALQQNLAEIYKIYKEYSKAEEFIKDNLEIVKRFGGKIYSRSDKEAVFDECTSLLGLGGLYVTMKQYADAESLFLDLLEKLSIGHFGYENEYNQSIMASVFWTLGMSYYYDKKYEKSDCSFKKAIEIEHSLALVDTSYYDILGHYLAFWAMFKLYQEQFEESESLYLKALDAYNTSTKENKELAVAQIWWHLGYLCQNTNRPTESEKWYKDALSVYRRYALALPEKYNDQLSIQIKGLASLYKELGRLEESESLFVEVHTIDSILSLKDPLKFSPAIAYVKNELGEIKVLQKKYYEADSLFNAALKIRKRFVEDDHNAYDSQVFETLMNLASLYSEMGLLKFSLNEYTEAIELLEKSEKYFLKIVNEINGDKNVIVTLYDNLSKVYREIGNYKKAAEYNKKAFYLLLNR